MSNRIYIKQSLQQDSLLKLSDENIHYLVNVLRLNDSSEIRVFNEKDGEYLAKIKKISKKEYALEILNKIRNVEQQNEMILAISLIKNDKFIFALEKATELGVTEIQPIICERSQYNKLNMVRILKCITEATEQSERFRVPLLKEPITLRELLDSNSYDEIIICSEKADESANLLKIKYSQNSCFVIGPEGGFSPKEFELMSDFKHITLANHILRAETAVIAIASQLQLISHS
jgi:16S rRNA (uracil1498-N3)-methyltransferase